LLCQSAKRSRNDDATRAQLSELFLCRDRHHSSLAFDFAQQEIPRENACRGHPAGRPPFFLLRGTVANQCPVAADNGSYLASRFW
jgi:hypothetical protein